MRRLARSVLLVVLLFASRNKGRRHYEHEGSSRLLPLQGPTLKNSQGKPVTHASLHRGLAVLSAEKDCVGDPREDGDGANGEHLGAANGKG